MCPAQAKQVRVVAFKCFGTLMNKYIVYHKIYHAVGCNAAAHPKAVIQCGMSLPYKPYGGECKTQRKHIVPFPECFLGLVMGFVNKPQRTVKQVFVNAPGESLHACKRGRKYEQMNQQGDQI
jgi:hypothetical protein